MEIMEARAKTTVTLALTNYDYHRLGTMIEAIHIVLTEGDFGAALGDGKMMVDHLEAAGEAIEWLDSLQAVMMPQRGIPPDD